MTRYHDRYKASIKALWHFRSSSITMAEQLHKVIVIGAGMISFNPFSYLLDYLLRRHRTDDCIEDSRERRICSHHRRGGLSDRSENRQVY